MIDWGAEAAEKYELKIENVRKGRGAWIFETDRGLKLLKEYKGSAKRLEFEEMVLGTLAEISTLKADQYMRNRENELITTAEDGTKYIIKDWFADRECSLRDTGEILSAVRQIAILHKVFRGIEAREEWNLRSMIAPPLYEDMDKHNRELRKIRSYVRDKRKKSEFELCVIQSYDRFYRQASEAGGKMKAILSEKSGELDKGYSICHGELNQHHVLIGRDYVAVTEFNKMHFGLQIEDLYYFTRKIIEKHDWNPILGDAIIDAYERVLPLSRTERECLYCLFLYPEKYWKQLNFYYNSNKAWIPARQKEKIENLERQEDRRMSFINSLLAERTAVL